MMEIKSQGFTDILGIDSSSGEHESLYSISLQIAAEILWPGPKHWRDWWTLPPRLTEPKSFGALKKCKRHRTENNFEAGAGLTSGHWTDQHGAELDDGAEDVLGVGGAGHILAVELEHQTLVLFLQQDQDVLQQNRVQLCEERSWWGGYNYAQPELLRRKRFFPLRQSSVSTHFITSQK